MRLGGYWRPACRKAIHSVLLKYDTRTIAEAKQLWKDVEKAYPFPERAGFAYDSWRAVVAEARDEHARRYPELYDHPLDRACNACHAIAGRHCRAVDELDPIVTDKKEREAILAIAFDADEEVREGRPSRRADANDLLGQVFHACRLAVVRRVVFDDGPLFGGAE